MSLNNNHLASNEFVVSIDRIPRMKSCATGASIPAISCPVAVTSTPFSDLKSAGDTITFDPVTIEFSVLEGISVWYDVQQWMRDNTPFSGFRTETGNEHSDIVITLLSNNKLPLLHIKFFNAIPINVTGFDLTYTQEDDITSSVTFEYDYYTIEAI